MSGRKKILMIVTNNEFLADGKTKTGVFFVEFCAPYQTFLAQDYDVTVASLAGGEAPIDPISTSILDNIQHSECKDALKDTAILDTIDYTNYDAVVFPGGHGPMFDIANSELVAKIVSGFDKENKLIAAICHGPAALLNAKDTDGSYIISGRRVTCFSNEEEILAKRDKLVPFFLEDALKERNGFYVEVDSGDINVMIDNNIITAQNEQSAQEFAQAVKNYLQKQN